MCVCVSDVGTVFRHRSWMLKMLRKLKPLDPLLDAAKDEEECEGALV